MRMNPGWRIKRFRGFVFRYYRFQMYGMVASADPDACSYEQKV